MSSKLLIIVATGEKEKAQTSIMYARNAIKYAWLDDIKVIFFGPSERLVAEDKDIAKEAQEIAKLRECVACKYISDKGGLSGDLTKLGIKIEYVGPIISNLIKDGYIPMVW
jgi:hypothetical protein